MNLFPAADCGIGEGDNIFVQNATKIIKNSGDYALISQSLVNEVLSRAFHGVAVKKKQIIVHILHKKT